MTSLPRRTFLKVGTAIGTAVSRPVLLCAPLFARVTTSSVPAVPIEDPHVKQLAQAGLDAALAAGADYADIRLTHVKNRILKGSTWKDVESMTVGIRALVNGYWGFASSPDWTLDEMARLGRTAAAIARNLSMGKPRSVSLAPVTVVQDGHWDMPVSIDPFKVSREEIEDFCHALVSFGKRFNNWAAKPFECRFSVTAKAFGSTDGSYWTQRLFRTGGSFVWKMIGTQSEQTAGLDQYLSPAGEGWERICKQPLREGIRQLHAELTEDTSLPIKPVDVGRYDAVFDARSLVDILNGSIGAATQLDRALGYEANASGTSYLNDPSTMLGTFQLGAPVLTVTGNRNAPGAVNTVRWDDENVRPSEFPIVTRGIFTNYTVSREGAGWLREMFSTYPLQSSGCLAAPEASDSPLSRIPNLVMEPSAVQNDFNSLVTGQRKGIVVKRASCDMDFQQTNGFGQGMVYEVKDGKRVALLAGAGFLFRTSEFWNSLQAVGGKNSQVRYGTFSEKGEPPQTTCNSVDVVPVTVKDLTVIDVMRKA